MILEFVANTKTFRGGDKQISVRPLPPLIPRTFPPNGMRRLSSCMKLSPPRSRKATIDQTAAAVTARDAILKGIRTRGNHQLHQMIADMNGIVDHADPDGHLAQRCDATHGADNRSGHAAADPSDFYRRADSDRGDRAWDHRGAAGRPTPQRAKAITTIGGAMMLPEIYPTRIC